MKKVVLFLSILLLSFPARAEESIILPDCEDSYLVEKVLNKVREFQKTETAESIIEKRRQQLILKNMEKFKEVPHAGFNASQDFSTANLLLMTKINKGIGDDNIRLCRCDTEGAASQVYVMVYYHDGEYGAAITNIAPDDKVLIINY